MSRKKTPDPPPPEKAKAGGRRWLIAGVLLTAAAGLLAWMLRSKPGGSLTNTGERKPFELPDETQTFPTYAGSQSCRECHAGEFEKWQSSHHGLAERNPSAEMDRAAFDPPKSFTHGTQTSEARMNGADFEVVTTGFENHRGPYKIERVLGHDPLRQFLVAGSGGRIHALEISWDPHKNEWFDVYGSEDRKPGEWGHWTGRGMVWNQMCAGCHNTRLRKNYDAASDSYRTSMAEMSVGCEACHGPMKNHTDWQRAHPGTPGDPTARKFTRDQHMDTCAQCHARRGELTGDFVPGEPFGDHYQLTIVDQTDTYYPDGQVRDENYEFASFVSSRMHHAGVRCQDCHDMHSMKTLQPGNQLCMRCHTPGGFPNAPVIVPEAHSFHKADSTGNQCINCHMPQTVYMQRHPRHDHGFTIPDPLLTQQFQIPNACNRCHTDKDAAWAQQAAEKWWGPKMERRTRQRARILATARAGSDPHSNGLLSILSGDEIPYWKASALLMLERWIHEPRVTDSIAIQTKHPDSLVRASAARVLEQAIARGRPDLKRAVQPLLDDPVRTVRNAAAWTLRDTLDLQSTAGQDLVHMLRHNADQPTGQLQLGQFHFSRGDAATAIRHLETAIRWDPHSPPFHHDLAIMQSTAGNTQAAIEALKKAVRLAPQEAEYHYNLGLAWSESGNLEETVKSLREAVKCRPDFGRAWYNLALALNSQSKTDEALKALQQAETVSPGDASIPYAAATILLRYDRKEEAMAAATRALQIQPGHAEARQLIMSLQMR